MKVRADWHTRALCARPDMTPYRDLFFPSRGEADKVQAAKQICAACPVRIACLEEALAEEGERSHKLRHGIRGGLLPRGRSGRYDRQRKTGPTA